MSGGVAPIRGVRGCVSQPVGDLGDLEMAGYLAGQGRAVVEDRIRVADNQNEAEKEPERGIGKGWR
jgi:hypothetical protein